MIKTNTVLILGAGASNDFGFPLGGDLKEMVITSLSSARFQNHLENGYGNRPTIKALVRAFINDLKKDKALTIDRFLAKSCDDYKRIGKVAITKAIMSCEDDAKIFAGHNTWYKVLYSILNSEHPDLSKFGSSNVSVITFNYDRSLEHFLYDQLCGDYGPSRQEEILSQLKRIPIIHMHGRVNMLPWEDRKTGIPYGDKREDYIPNLFNIAEKLIVPTYEHVSDILENAESAIKKAETIYFLGFGYDLTNLRKLGLDLIKSCNRVYGTAHEFSVAQRRSINDIFSRELIRFNSKKVHEYMMDLFDPDDDRVMSN